MILKLNRKTSGFSTAELVVTLFVATTYIFAGYETFKLATKDSGLVKNLNETHQNITNKLEEIKLNPPDFCPPPGPTEDNGLTITCQTITLDDTNHFYKITAKQSLLEKDQFLEQTIYVKQN